MKFIEKTDKNKFPIKLENPVNEYLHFSCLVTHSKKSACSARDLASIPGLGRSPGEGNDYSLQYSYLENSMD